MTTPRFTEADRAYVRANYLTLEELCAERSEEPAEVRRLIELGLLPRPSYTSDGVDFFPADYFQLYDEAGGSENLRALFQERYEAAAAAHPELATSEAFGVAWRAYLDGIWGQCLRAVTPEAIVRKRSLVASLCELIALPRRRQPEWQEQLRAEVAELDRLERPFAPWFVTSQGTSGRRSQRSPAIASSRSRARSPSSK
jgi:hypothetical protein